MDINQLMSQFQQIQEKLSKIQSELGNKVVTGAAGGGMVTATVNGRQELISISIEKELINPDQREMLQDLVLAAVNDGLRKAKELHQNELTSLTGGYRIPGLF